MADGSWYSDAFLTKSSFTRRLREISIENVTGADFALLSTVTKRKRRQRLKPELYIYIQARQPFAAQLFDGAWCGVTFLLGKNHRRIKGSLAFKSDQRMERGFVYCFRPESRSARRNFQHYLRLQAVLKQALVMRSRSELILRPKQKVILQPSHTTRGGPSQGS